MQVATDTFGQRILYALEYRKLLKVELAKACGMSPSAVTQWIDGTTKTYDASKVLKAAKFLRVRLEWLLENAGPMEDLTDPEASEIGRLFALLPEGEKIRLGPIIKAVIGPHVTDKDVEEKMPITKPARRH